MPAIASPVGPSVLLASTTSLTGVPSGVPSLAAFLDLMVGQGTPAPTKMGAGGIGRQKDAATGNSLPEGDDKPTPDPALAWMLAAPPVVTPLPVPNTVAGGAGSRQIVDISSLTTTPADPTLPTPAATGTAAPIADPSSTPASPGTAPALVVKPTIAMVTSIDTPPAILVAAPTMAVEPVPAPVTASIAKAPPNIQMKASPNAGQPATPVATPPTQPVTPVASTVPVLPISAPPTLAPLSAVDTPPSILVAGPAAPDPGPAIAAAPAPADPAQPIATPTPAPRFELPRQPAPRLVTQAPVVQQAKVATTVVQPALFALAGLAERNALDREDRTAATSSDAITPLQTAASLAVAAAGDAQQQSSLDLGRHDWPQKMIEHIDALRDQANANDTSIRLKPEALGRVDVALRTHDDGAISVRFTAEQPATRTLLADAAPQLEQAAEARGIRLSGTSVDLAGSGQGDQRPRPELDRRQPITNHLAASRGDDTDAVADGRIA